jgi:hypothetical protein
MLQEYRAMKIEEDILTIEAEIETYREQHDDKVSLNAEFMKVSRKLDEVLDFKEDKLIVSDALLSLSSSLLEGMHLDRVEYSDGTANIQGSVLVPAEEASGIVNDYLKAIDEADAFQGLVTEYKLTSLDRSSAGGVIAFRIEVTAKEEKK